VHVCPPGLAEGSACSVGNQYCFGGSHNACRCGPDTGSVWECS
jgi:hypothetical protein